MSYAERFVAAFALILMSLVCYNLSLPVSLVVFTCILGAAFFATLIALASYTIWPERPKD